MPVKNASLWLCLAKMVLHLTPNEPILPTTLSPYDHLKFIRELPGALSQIRTSVQTDPNILKG